MGHEGIGEFQGKTGPGEHDETGGEEEMLPALGGVHAEQSALGAAVEEGGFAAEDEGVVDSHQADDDEDQGKVDFPDPPIDLLAHLGVGGFFFNVHMDLALGEVGAGAVVAFAASGDQVVLEDAGTGV